jgi:hypothetical protein
MGGKWAPSDSAKHLFFINIMNIYVYNILPYSLTLVSPNFSHTWTDRLFYFTNNLYPSYVHSDHITEIPNGTFFTTPM